MKPVDCKSSECPEAPVDRLVSQKPTPRELCRWSKPLLIAIALLANAGVVAEIPSGHSVARAWNEALLQSIREDRARPTVHARNLYHLAVAMWDAWSAFDETARPVLLGNHYHGFFCGFDGMPTPRDLHQARSEAISHAAYRLLRHRFQASPGRDSALLRFELLMVEQGLDPSASGTDYHSGDPAQLGNYIAQCVIDYGLQDGSNERADYASRFYQPVNPPLVPPLPGNPTIRNPNRWQPITFDRYIDQAGHQSAELTPDFLGPEWGFVDPFALRARDLTLHERDGQRFQVYHDPGAPPWLEEQSGDEPGDYQWTHSLVLIWSSMLDPDDGVIWDISPASLGNNPVASLPRDVAGQRDFYRPFRGGDPGRGRPVNPRTKQPYTPQRVPRGDYTRVVAEYWADGPDSESPPGHWFTLLNYVSDHPALVKRYRGVGPVLGDLQWDVTAYLALGGAMHDAAIAAWSIKGWYDYIRPISALRAMADRGQSSDPSLPRYDPLGIPLLPGYVELVEEADSLVGQTQEHLHKIKVRSWRGPRRLFVPRREVAGVGWILAENWWPYQRPTFITPPFAGYVSGHSTFSRAAAEVLTLLTGDEYFPGGLGEFHAKKNRFLVFEKGPSVDVTLQWATYRDASDQSSLSRIWGGIHPPADDIPGRLIGQRVGTDAFAFAQRFILGQ